MCRCRQRKREMCFVSFCRSKSIMLWSRTAHREWVCPKLPTGLVKNATNSTLYRKILHQRIVLRFDSIANSRHADRIEWMHSLWVSRISHWFGCTPHRIYVRHIAWELENHRKASSQRNQCPTTRIVYFSLVPRFHVIFGFCFVFFFLFFFCQLVYDWGVTPSEWIHCCCHTLARTKHIRFDMPENKWDEFNWWIVSIDCDSIELRRTSRIQIHSYINARKILCRFGLTFLTFFASPSLCEKQQRRAEPLLLTLMLCTRFSACLSECDARCIFFVAFFFFIASYACIESLRVYGTPVLDAIYYKMCAVRWPHKISCKLRWLCCLSLRDNDSHTHMLRPGLFYSIY